jgi:hypothetical protein
MSEFSCRARLQVFKVCCPKFKSTWEQVERTGYRQQILTSWDPVDDDVAKCILAICLATKSMVELNGTGYECNQLEGNPYDSHGLSRLI